MLARSALSPSVSSPEPEAWQAPVFPLSATLVTRDAEALAAFYTGYLGFERYPSEAGRVALGAGGEVLLRLEERREARLRRGGEAGLFHIAFVLPDRMALARWFLAAHAAGAPFDGASDHAVSEAFYLNDPEGNGIEVYVDRQRRDWPREGSGYAMTTAPMAIGDLVGLAGDPPATAPTLPAGTRIGHFHLQVGDVAEAAQFWQDALGMEEMHRRPGARFLSWGGYHHHLGINHWQSRGSGPLDPETTGLKSLVFGLRDAGLKERLAALHGARQQGEAIEIIDPAGITARFTPL